MADVTELIIDTKHATPDYVDDGHPCIRTPNIGRGFFILDDVRQVSEQTYLEWIERAVPLPNDLILAREAPVGNVAIVPSRLRPCLGQRTVLIRPDRNQAHPRYLMYLLLGEELQGTMQSLANGATVPHLNMKDIRSLPLPDLPPLPTQRKIAAILSAYDDLIENNLRRIRILEEMAQNLYREWFVEFRFPGHENVPMVDSPLGRIPEGWEMSVVADTFATLGGGTPSKSVHEYWAEGVIDWYCPTDLTRAGSMFVERSGTRINELGLKKSSAQLFPAFSVMMTSRATLGVIAINTTEACTNQGFITCVPSERFPLYTLYYWLKENAERLASLGTGATFKEITKGVFRTIELLVPARRLAHQFEDTLRPFACQILNLQRRNSNLRRTRDLLLPRLISGELDVSALDIAIPQEDLDA